MKGFFHFSRRLLAIAAMIFPAASVWAQGTAFTYQGRILSNSSPATGLYSLQFVLRSAATNGSQIAGPLVNQPVNVSNGLFTVTLDFGNVYSSNALFLEVGVRTNGSSSAFTILAPAQAFTSTPFAVNALNATAYSGAISDAQLSTNIARLNASQTFSSNVTFVNASGSFQGTVTGTNVGSFIGNGIGLTNLPLASQTNAGVVDPNTLIAIRYPANNPYTHPPMVINGWSDYQNDQGTEYDFHNFPPAPTPGSFIGHVNALASSGLLQLGWNTVVIDGGWVGYRDATGQLHENAQAWPDGISNCVRYAHSLGIKVGLYFGLSLTTDVGGGLVQAFQGQGTLGYTTMLTTSPTNIGPNTVVKLNGPICSTTAASQFRSPLGLAVGYQLSGPGTSTQTVTFDTSSDGTTWVTNALSFNSMANGTTLTSFTNDLPWPPPAFIRVDEVHNTNATLTLQNLTVTNLFYAWYGNTNSANLFTPGMTEEQIVAKDAQWFGSMGIDYVKLEMGTNNSYTDAQEAQDVRLWVSSMQSAGMQSTYLMSAMGLDRAQPWQVGLVNAQRAGSFDMPNYTAGTNYEFLQFTFNFFWAALHPENSGPGNYISTDIIPDNTSTNVQNTLLIMQSMLSSELCFAGLFNIAPAYNRNIIAIDQDPAAKMAVCIYTNGTVAPMQSGGNFLFNYITGLSVWKKTLASPYNDQYAVMFLNTSTSNMSFTVTSLAILQIDNFTNAFCLDLVSNVTTMVSTNWTVTVPPSTAYGFKLSGILPSSSLASGAGSSLNGISSLNGSLVFPNTPTGPNPATLGASNSVALWASNGVLYARTSTDGTNFVDKKIAP